jgi:biopolymer transport protein ExbB
MWQFLVAGGPFMLFLVLTSIISLTFIVERSWALRHGRVLPPNVEEALEKSQTKEDLQNLRVLCQQKRAPLSRLVLTAIEHLPWPKADNADCVQTRARHEVVLLERGLVVLEIVVGIAPLLGLVGTIHGLITLFGDLGKSGLAENAVLAKGIAIALNTTLMGLLIAIPTIIAWSYFSKKVESLAVEMETLLDDFLRRQYRHKAGGSKSSSPARAPEIKAVAGS